MLNSYTALAYKDSFYSSAYAQLLYCFSLQCVQMNVLDNIDN